MPSDPLRFVRPDFVDLEEYEPVKPLEVLAREIGVPVGQLVKLDANENLYGPRPEIRDAVAAADFHIYPDPSSSDLRAAIGRYLNVDAAQIVAGAGADDLIDILIRLTGPERIVIAPPTFGMYSFLGKIGGAKILSVPRTPGPEFEIDLDGIRAAVDAGARMIFLASPNNPTGNVLTDFQVEALADAEAIVVVDEAYAEFAETSVVPLAAKHSNLVVLRTFSKWAALAGLRIGYGIAHPELAARMMAIKQPYNVNVAADVAARKALELRAEILEDVRCLVAERERLIAETRKLGWLEPVPSQANFVLFRVVGRDAKTVVTDLRNRGVLVRYYARAELSDYIRISAGRPEDIDRLMQALRELD